MLCLLCESTDFSPTICEQLTHKIRESQHKGFDLGLPCQPVEYNPSSSAATTCLQTGPIQLQQSMQSPATQTQVPWKPTSKM